MRETAERAWDNEPEWIWAIEDLITIDMQRLREQVGLLAESAAENNIAALRDVQTWLERLEHPLLGMRRDLRIFAPWTERLASPPSGCAEIAARVAALMTYGMTSPVGAGGAPAPEALPAFPRRAVSSSHREVITDYQRT